MGLGFEAGVVVEVEVVGMEFVRSCGEAAGRQWAEARWAAWG